MTEPSGERFGARPFTTEGPAWRRGRGDAAGEATTRSGKCTRGPIPSGGRVAGSIQCSRAEARVPPPMGSESGIGPEEWGPGFDQSRTGRRRRGLTLAPTRHRLKVTIEARGDLPPLAATLNKELKSDSPGGAARPAFLLSAIADSPRARPPMPVASLRISSRRHATIGACASVLGAKRIGMGTGRMCTRMCTGRIRGCRPETAARPGDGERG